MKTMKDVLKDILDNKETQSNLQETRTKCYNANRLQEIICESYIPDSLLKKATPFTVGKISGHRITVSDKDASDVKSKIHHHLTANGFKREASISDVKNHTYIHNYGEKVHVTHYDKSITVEKG